MASLTCAPPLQRRGNLHRLAPPQTRVIAAKAAIQVSAPVLQRRPRRARPRKCSTAQRVGRTKHGTRCVVAFRCSMQVAPRRALPDSPPVAHSGASNRGFRVQAGRQAVAGVKCRAMILTGLRAGVHAGLFAASGIAHDVRHARPLCISAGAAATANRCGRQRSPQTRFISAMRSPLPRFGVMPQSTPGPPVLQRCGPVPRGRCRRGMPVTPPRVPACEPRPAAPGMAPRSRRSGCGQGSR